MKNTARYILIIVFTGSIVFGPQLLRAQDQQQDNAQLDYNSPDDNNVTLQTFYDELAPYGQWIEDPTYQYVWVPDVPTDFRPYYTNGRWVMTDYGNTWVSDYPWGWAAFHYGRWTYDNNYGWIWIPDTVWGPAWVSWRENDIYYGWAPLGPGISIGMGWDGNYYCPNNWWVFMQPEYIYSRHYNRYWFGAHGNRGIVAQTRPLVNTFTNNGNHTTYVIGPRASEVERITQKKVDVYRLGIATAPAKTKVKNDVVSIYRPRATAAASGVRPVPQHLVKAPVAISKPQSVSNTAPQYRARFGGNSNASQPSLQEVQPPAPQNIAPRTAPSRHQMGVIQESPVSNPNQEQPTYNRVEQPAYRPATQPQMQPEQPQFHQAPRPAPAPMSRPAPPAFHPAAPQPIARPMSAPAPQAPHASPPAMGGRK